MPQQRPWNKYEVVLLIECYINVTENGCNLKDELTRLSAVLRRMAINDGIEIDDVYRNLNGMYWQYGLIKSAIDGLSHERKPSQLFIEMADLYKNDKSSFNELLKEAHHLSRKNAIRELSSEEVKKRFSNWLSNKGINQSQSQSFIECLSRVSQYALSRNISKTGFWQIQDFHVFNKVMALLLKNKIFKISHPIDSRTLSKVGKFYSDYINEEFGLETSTSSVNISTQNNSNLNTICQTNNADTEKSIVDKDKSQSFQDSLDTDDYDKCISQFRKWLFQNNRFSERTAINYTYSIKSADAYALKHNIISESLITSKDDVLSNMVEKLLSDPLFSAYNSNQHNRFSASLNAYLVFRLGENNAARRQISHTKIQTEDISRKITPSNLRELLTKYFPYGIRPNSAIDVMKLRGFAETLGVDISQDNETLKTQIISSGDEFEGKIYFITDSVLSEIKSRIQSIFNTGVCVIYYDILYDSDFSWFDEHHISSSDHVRELMKMHMKNVFCSRNFIREGSEKITELDAVEEELKRIWGDCVTHTYDELYSLLPYIPDDKIRFYLSRSNSFIWSSPETFALLDKFVISDNEKEEILKYANSVCDTAGFVSISDLPLENIIEENYEISISAVYDEVYRTVLASHFQINGKIITRNDGETDALTLTKAYCAEKDECLVSDLNEYVVSITGARGRQTALRAAYDIMIRVSKEKFVSEKYVEFDTDAIDALIDEAIKGDFASVRSIVAFIMFPSCGQAWNHYVLESFCYRFSKKYRLEVINFNDKNAGIIVKKDCTLSYNDMLAIAAANSKIELSEENVGRYLCDNGYAAKSKMTILSEVINKAQEIRRQGM